MCIDPYLNDKKSIKKKKLFEHKKDNYEIKKVVVLS